MPNDPQGDDPTWADARRLLRVTPADVGARIRSARQMRRLSLADLGTLVGRSAPAVQQWEVGQAEPGLERLLVLSEHLKVDPFELIAGAEVKVDPDWFRKELRKASPLDDEVEFVDDDGDEATVAAAPKRHPNRVRGRAVPLIDNHEVALKSCDLPVTNYAVSFEDVVSHFPCSEEAFALQIADKRNSSKIEKGDIVIIDPAAIPRPGSMILVRLNDNVVLGQLDKKDPNSAMLRAANAEWPPLSLKGLNLTNAKPAFVVHTDGRPVAKPPKPSKPSMIIGVMVEHTAPNRD